MSKQESVYVIGAGGHAKVVVRSLQRLGYNVSAVFDDNRALWENVLCGVPIRGPVADIAEVPTRRTVIAIGNNRVRAQLATFFKLPYLSVVDPHALVDPSVTVGRGSVVLPGAVVQVDATLGDHVIVNHGATVDHDCMVRSCAHLAPGVHLTGGVTIGTGVLMGAGAVAVPGTEVGDWTVVGAGAVVANSLPANAIAMGVPARPKRSVDTRVAHVLRPGMTDGVPSRGAPVVIPGIDVAPWNDVGAGGSLTAGHEPPAAVSREEAPAMERAAVEASPAAYSIMHTSIPLGPET